MSIEIRPFQMADTEATVSLWQETGLSRPWNNPYQDIRRKLTVQPELFLVAVDRGEQLDTGDGEAAGVGDGIGAQAPGELVGTVMAGYDGHRGWLYYLASASARRGEGIGRRLVEAAEERLLELGCPKVQLMGRPENGGVHAFYGELGYEPFDTWTTGKRLIAD